MGKRLNLLLEAVSIIAVLAALASLSPCQANGVHINLQVHLKNLMYPSVERSVANPSGHVVVSATCMRASAQARARARLHAVAKLSYPHMDI